MRLENNSSQGVTDSNRASATRASGPEVSTGHMQLPKGTTDQVNLSGASNLLSLARTVSPDRQNKVQSLAAQYSSGSYRANSAATSRSLVASLKN